MSEALPKTEDLRGTWLVLVMASIGMTVIAYNTTAVITILPDLRSQFDLRPTTLQWVMNVYTLSAATLVPVTGRLGDLAGRMPVYLFGNVVLACLVAGLAATLLAAWLMRGPTPPRHSAAPSTRSGAATS